MVGVLIVDRDGIIIKSTINEVVDTIQNYGLSVAQIVESGNKAMSENGELQFLRMKTKRNEFIVVPGKFVCNLLLLLLRTCITLALLLSFR